MSRSSAYTFTIALLLVATIALLTPAAATARPRETLVETYVDARFYAENGCHSYTVDVMGSTSTRHIARKVEQLASVSVSIFIFDRCENREFLSVSGYQEVAIEAVRVSRDLRGGSVTATVPVFVPMGPGYYLDVPVTLQFEGTGKVERIHRRWTDCSEGACVYRSLVGGTNIGQARAEVVLPPLQGLLFSQPLNLTPIQSVRASVTHLVTTMR